jgi:hypothetical protein
MKTLIWCQCTLNNRKITTRNKQGQGLSACASVRETKIFCVHTKGIDFFRKSNYSVARGLEIKTRERGWYAF